MSKSLVVGLTGGIGSGKSTVANLFAEFGATVIDTDVIARDLTQPNGAAMPALIAAFGGSYVDGLGGLNRPAMRALVFSDSHAKRHLEEILHPLIKAAALEQLVRVESSYSILVIPLLVESNDYRGTVDRILIIDCDEQTQLIRTMTRGGLGEDMVRAIIASQATRRQRCNAADDVIDNDGDLVELRSTVHALHQRYLALAGKSAGKGSE